VTFDGQDVVELKDECNDRFLRASKVCVENYESRPDGIFACNVRVDKMVKELEGKGTTFCSRCWYLVLTSTGKFSIRVEHTDRRRSEKTVDFNLEMVDLPKTMKLSSAGSEVHASDILQVEGGGRRGASHFDFECSGTSAGGRAKPQLKLYAGKMEIVAEEEICRDDDLYVLSVVHVLHAYIVNPF
jgi:hypothetical protein